MHRPRHWMAAAAVAAGLAGCGAAGTQPGQASPPGPARLEPITGSDLTRVTLTAVAARKLDVRTAPVSAAAMPEEGKGPPALRVPLSAIVYVRNGSTWVYVVDEPFSYVRRPVSLVSVDGDTAVLQSGPPAGSQVVIVGAQELLGAELGVAGEAG